MGFRKFLEELDQDSATHIQMMRDTGVEKSTARAEKVGIVAIAGMVFVMAISPHIKSMFTDSVVAPEKLSTHYSTAPERPAPPFPKAPVPHG